MSSKFLKIKGVRNISNTCVPKEQIETNVSTAKAETSVSTAKTVLVETNPIVIAKDEVKVEIKAEVKAEVKDEVKAEPKKQKIFQKKSFDYSQAPVSAAAAGGQPVSKVPSMFEKISGTIKIANYDGEEVRSYDGFKLDENLLKAIHTLQNFDWCSPIQAYAIPPVLDKRSILVQGQAGTGKTNAYAVPGIQNIDPAIKQMQMFVLSPTRELNLQTYEVFKLLTTYMNINVAAHIGGSIGKNERGVDYLSNVTLNKETGRYTAEPYSEQIVIATPGRFQMLINKNIIKTDSVKFVVLDEADKMLGQGFLPSIIEIFSKIPDKVQLALYSATLSHEIKSLASDFMENPVTILISNENVVLDNQTQYIVQVGDNIDQKFEILMNIFESVAVGQVIIFANRIYTVNRIAKYLTDAGISNGFIHAEIPQAEREKNMANFRAQKIKVLTGTDILARGIDTDVSLVINFDIPNDIEQYVHRIGRTGRFGKTGNVINITTKYDVELINRTCKFYRIKMSDYSQFSKKVGTASNLLFKQ
jgi:superfamily II DNA/RNA helicase